MDDYKYLAIAEWAKRIIEERSLAAGDRFFSEAELCEIHNVSRQTVRAALAVMESENIIRRRQGSGTFVQSPGRAKSGFTVGVISTYFSDYIFPGIVTGIEQVLSRRHAVMQLATTRNLVAEEARALRSMLAQDIRGLIIEPSKSALPNPGRRGGGERPDRASDRARPQKDIRHPRFRRFTGAQALSRLPEVPRG